ncbi:FtsK/SpoIIIE domain-containing protein [Kineosporia sp. NBRC 101677]|uniref:FtsK/SpoIIIE domain-containing protein n=1 Tax=Kineosporia sp. NBRC 101677 TaxID=3032197 RepID=UPI0025531A6A|nr:FtsK/SpoIIIE domain-containing protein [Kineosporia sp. NBRC 101677]
MRLRVTVVVYEIEVPAVDVEIEASTGTTFGAVASQLALLAPGRADRPIRSDSREFHCLGRPLPATHPLGLPPLVQGAMLVLGAVGRSVPRPGGALELHVVSGPDAGLTHPLLSDRSLLVGRHGSCDLPLADPGLSRRHAEIGISGGVTTVRDLLSANGTWLLDEKVGPAGQALPTGTALRLGGSTLVVRAPDRPVAAVLPDGAGHLLVNRRRALHGPRPGSTIEMPTPATSPARAHLPWLMVLAPLFLAVPAALIWRQPAYLLIAVLSPLLMLAQYTSDRRRGRKEGRQRAADHELAQQKAERSLTQALVADLEYLETAHPDLARLATTARVPTDELWQRTREQPAGLTVRLGRGPAPSNVTVRGPHTGGLSGAAEARQLHPDAPVVLDLAEFAVIGISGPRDLVLGTARSIVGQLVVLHSPLDLVVSLCQAQPLKVRHGEPGTVAGEWDWLAWLPHHTAASALDNRPGRLQVMVLDGAQRQRSRAEIAQLLTRADSQAHRPGSSAAGIVVICLEQDEPSLPLECAATVVHSGSETKAVLRRVGHVPLTFRADLAGADWADRLARVLAPLRDATSDGAGALPSQVRLLDLGRSRGRPESLSTAELAGSWSASAQRPAAGPQAVLGMSAAGPVRVSLATDGPHLLIGGTTGAGKSELLQTLIASLAIGSGPDRLTFLLVDYKGGAAFQACSDLPHVGALLTDLDQQSARRALTSFNAELRRRERLLLEAGCTDIAGYDGARLSDGSLPPMPRLVVVVDEFRVLVEELSEFVAGLVRIATVGRSLGVHLVLATQRPAGVVSPDIAANMNLRIALRVRDAADSHDLISDPAAAGLPRIPGRALLRIGGDGLIEFQTAQVSGKVLEGAVETPPRVRRLEPGSDSAAGPPDAYAQLPEPGHQSDLERVVAATKAAAAATGQARARAPWLPELPTDLELGRMASAATGRGLPFGLIDRPEQQHQEPAVWDLTAGHLAVVGAPRSGRSTLLRSLGAVASQVATDQGATAVHCYALDPAGRLSDLEQMGWAHAVVRPDDHERSSRLLRRLRGELVHRQAERTAAAPIVLLVDGWEAVTSAWSEPGLVDLHDDLVRLLRDGAGSGICLAVAGGISLLTGSYSSLFAHRLVLRLPDPTEAAMLGIPAGPARSTGTGPPGRGAWLAAGEGEFCLLQVARAAETPRHRPGADHPWHIPALPTRLSRSDLPPVGIHERCSRGSVPIGIGGDRVHAVRVDVLAAPVTVILGSRGSGRSTALRSLYEGLVEQGISSVLLPGHELRGPGAAEALARHLAGPDNRPDNRPGKPVLLLDLLCGPDQPGPDTDRLTEVLALHLGRDDHGAGHLVLTASAAEVLGAYRGVLTLARDARQGLVLGGTAPADGEVLGVRLPRRPAGPPGRGVLIARGTVTAVQVARPTDTPLDDGDGEMVDPEDQNPPKSDQILAESSISLSDRPQSGVIHRSLLGST